MAAITVKELAEACEKAISKGHGNKQVWISSDDEGNDFHGLYYLFTYEPEAVKEIAENTCGHLSDNEDTSNIVLLG